MANRVPYPMVQRSGAYGGHPPPHPAPYHGYPNSSYGPPQPPPPQQQHYHHPPQHHHPHPGMHPQQQHHHNMAGRHHYPMVPAFNAGPPPIPQSQPPGPMKGSYHHHMPPYGTPYGMIPYQHHHHATIQQPQPYPTLTNSSSDSASISSKSSINSKKKRTIDGIAGSSSGNNGNSNNKTTSNSSHSSGNNMGNVPSAYTFRRTDSNSSTTSTVTAGNNTSLETNQTEESPHRIERSDSLLPALNIDGMIFDDQSTHQSRPNSRQGHPPKPHRYHRRDYSAASTASSLSVGGFSLSSYEKSAGVIDDAIMSENNNIVKSSSPKRHKKLERAALVVDTSSGNENTSERSSDEIQPMETNEARDLEHLSIDHKEPPSTSSESSSCTNSNLFLTLSTSPINAQPDVDATPISKNTTKQREEVVVKNERDSIFNKLGNEKCRPNETPTPPVHGELGDSEMLNDDHNTLNHHLRGQSFTPLPHAGNCGEGSPSHPEYASAIAPQLSWSIAGETPSMDDLDEWEDEHSKLKTEHKIRPGSTTSTETRNMTISPHDFQMWKEEHELVDRALSGTTTPLPVFFEQPMRGEGSENQNMHRRLSDEQFHPMYSTSSNNNTHGLMSTTNKHSSEHHHPFWSKHATSMGLPPTPVFATSDYRDDSFGVRSPMHMERRDNSGMEYMPSYPHHHNGHHGNNDRIRNLRGRVPPGSHLPPMPLHIPPHMSTHLPMTSPMGLGPKAGMWSPHHGMSMGGSPHHNMGSPLNNMAQSKRKCVPLKPPIPSKFQGDMDKVKNAPVPEFTSLVNFPSHMSQKQSVNLPEGMRCCVMCGSACPCSMGNKTGKKNSNANGKAGSYKSSEGGSISSCGGSLGPRSSNGQDHHIGDKNCGYAIIPTQNKGLCTLCDVNVWVVVTTGLEIKWCKGCKNFRPWAAFGDKGLATKCLRCRERQREKYALQKEEKEKTRVVGPTSKVHK